MRHQIFTVFDHKAEAYLPPFFVQTIGLATRAFTDCVNSQSHQFGKHPADYTLIHVGEWDDSDNYFDVKGLPKPMGSGLQYVAPKTEALKNEVHSNSPIRPNGTSGDSTLVV